MRIRIVCPVSLAYEGDAAFVSIPSTDGEFGVLLLTPAKSARSTAVTFAFPIRPWHCRPHVCRGRRLCPGCGRCRDRPRRARLRFGDRRRDKVKADIQGFEEKLGNLSEDDARRAYLYNEIAWCKLKLAQ